MRPLETLFEDPLAGGELPEPLASAYGGGLGLAEDVVYANFVSSLDGVVSMERRRGSGSAISGREPADRFLMGLLRTLADAILVGAGTVRSDGGQPWTAAWLSPAHADAFAALERPDPLLVVATRSGELDPAEPAFLAPTLVLTTAAGEARLRGRLPASARLRTLAALDAGAILEAIRAEGCRRVLTEGGPRMLTSLIAAGLVDELFLTLAPVLAGRNGGERLGLLTGLELLPSTRRPARLLSVKSQGSLLFLRYLLQRT